MKNLKLIYMSKRILFFIIFISTLSYNIPAIAKQTKFSQCFSVMVPRAATDINKHPKLQIGKTRQSSHLIWEETPAKPFTELIPSWNIVRPKKGRYTIFVNVKHNYWSGWRKIAECGTNMQKSYCNTRDSFVHVKHVRVEMQKKRLARAYKIKVVAERGANLLQVKTLFANTANWNYFTPQRPSWSLPSTRIPNVPKQSQWHIKHHRTKDLCSPTSISMINHYFTNKNRSIPLAEQARQVANNVHDKSLDIYGNWLCNTYEAFNASKGTVLYRVERLNNFEDLHRYLTHKIPVAVSIRGNLQGCAWPYKNGHFVVVVGWDKQKRKVICIDPAFRNEKYMVREYRVNDFITAWGKSRNLSYIPIPHRKFL